MAKIILLYFKLLRPQQWIKNLLLLFPPFFAGRLFDPAVTQEIVPALVAFCCAASCGYLINDIVDVETDKNHFVKKGRAIASGRVPLAGAIIFAIVLYLVSMMLALSIHGEFRRFQWFLILYLFNSLAYTFFLKNIVIIDIFFIAFGFIIRVMAGSEAFRTPVTSWLFLTVFLVSLMLAGGKRLGEVIQMGLEASNHRRVLRFYSPTYLEGVLWFSASTALVTYSLYTLEHQKGLIYTVPLAAYGLLRYIYIVKLGKGDPTEVLLSDSHVIATGLFWALMIGIITYVGK